jgi:hypothetical protein
MPLACVQARYAATSVSSKTRLIASKAGKTKGSKKIFTQSEEEMRRKRVVELENELG